MFKNYIINDQQLSLLKEDVSIRDIKLPQFIIDSIKSGKTSLGKHPAFPPDSVDSFEEKILKKRYYELLSDVKKIEDINGDMSKKRLIDLLGGYVNKCKKIEEEIKEDLEKLCLEHVYDIFGMTPDDVNIKCSIVTNVNSVLPLNPELIEGEFNDIDHINNLNDDILKRRLVNSLIQGSSVRFAYNYEKILSKIYSLNHSLPELYYNITTINEYLSFVKEQIPSKDSVGGEVFVDLTSDTPNIRAEAIIFPTLLFETIKGVMELISSVGLPDSLKDAEYVIGQADFLIAENWDKRFGVGMWDNLISLIGYDNSDIAPLVFSEIVSFQPEQFNTLFKEIFANTKKGKSHIKNIVDSIRKDRSFEEISDAISIKNVEGDEYFSPEELINGLHETDTTSVGDYTYDVPAFGDKETLDHKNMIQKSIQESKDYYDFFDVDYVVDTISEFLSDKEKGIKKKRWKLIPFIQYKNALIEFMRYGKFMRFPSKYIDQWVNIVTMNTLTLKACTELAGHTQWFPFDEFCDAFGFEEDSDEYEKYYNNYENCSNFLGEIGMYDWMMLPDGTPSFSDYGMEPLLKLIAELEEQNTPEEKIVVINKILDVYHQNGDLASGFIEGGSRSLSQISYGND